MGGGLAGGMGGGDPYGRFQGQGGVMSGGYPGNDVTMAFMASGGRRGRCRRC